MNPSASTPGGGKSADEMRRSSLNMEKMIKKNVMASRPGPVKRGLAVVEYIKQQQQKQQEETERTAPKRSKKDAAQTPSPSTTTPSSSLRTSQAMSALVGPPATPLVSRGATSPVAAPASATTALLTATHRSSPLRTSVSAAARASPLRAAAIRASPLRSARASPLRQVFTSPSRRVVAPRLPEVTTGGVPPVHPPVLNLDQLDVAAATPLKPPTLPAKSPFQSFQSKLGQARLKSPSPARPSPSQPPIRRANPLPTQLDSAQSSSSSSAGNTEATAVDLTEEKASTLPTPAPHATASMAFGGSSALTTAQLPSRPLARSLFSSNGSVATKSLCFTTEGVASSIDVSPDGECVVVAFTDGSIRLYEMDSNVPSDRHGYLLGHLDEESNQSSAGAHLRVKISSDGRHAFVGCRSGPRVMMSINLQSYRNGKDADDDMDQMQKSFHSNSRLRGFSDVASCIVPNNSDSTPAPPSSYYLLCGLGVGTMYMWKFNSPRSYGDDPEWKHLYSIPTNGNTVVIASFLPQPNPSSTLQIAGKCEDKNVRVWNLDTTKNDDGDIFHAVQGHYDLSSSKDVVAFFGNYAYGIAPTGEACRFRIPSEAVPVVRTYFEMERFDTGSSAKSRRSNVILESIYASDDGMVVVAVSADGIFYYTKDAPEDPSVTGCTLRIIGRNASLNPQYKSPMKVYKPTTASGSCLDAVMAVITNPQNEDDGEDGFVNVDLTETWAGRWMKPSRGEDCWVCGVRNIRHWQKEAQPQRRPLVEASKTVYREAVSVPRQSPSHKSSTKAKSATPKDQSNDSPDNQPSTKTTSIEAASRPTKPSQHRGSTSEATKMARAKPAPVKRLDVDGAATASADDEDVQDPVQELARLKTKYDKITIEWKRRILGERQMRRLCKEREEEFQKQLAEAYTKLHEAEQKIVALTEAQKDAEKRFGFEKLKAEQQSGVKAQYEQLCEQMQEKMVALEHQQRLMEQTTRSLLQEVDRHVQHSKQSVNSLVERQQNECILCKDSTAVTAIVPCGHLCFCDEDAEVYRRNFRGGAQITCPICQADVISMLRVY